MLLNVVLSMTIKWQAAGERAIRDACAGSNDGVCVVVRDKLADDSEGARRSATGKKRVVLGSGGARVHAGKISRADVADVIVEAIRRPECANATIRVAGRAAAESVRRNSRGIQRAGCAARVSPEDSPRGEVFATSPCGSTSRGTNELKREKPHQRASQRFSRVSRARRLRSPGLGPRTPS